MIRIRIFIRFKSSDPNGSTDYIVPSRAFAVIDVNSIERSLRFTALCLFCTGIRPPGQKPRTPLYFKMVALLSYSPKRLKYQYVCVDFLRHRNDSSATLVLPTSTRSAAHKSLERRDKSIAKELSKRGGPRRRSCRALSQLMTPPPPPPPLSSLQAPAAGIAAPCFPLLTTVCEYSLEVVVSCMNCLLSHR